MSNYYPVGGSGFPQTEDSLLEVQKRALFKRSYNVVTALSSASRTTTTSTGTLSNPGYKGIIVTLTISAISAGGLKVRIFSGVSGANTVYLDSTSMTTVSSRTIAVYPGMTSTASQFGSPGIMGPVFAIQVEPDTADAITYTLSYALVE